jgi:hypothetical protein
MALHPFILRSDGILTDDSGYVAFPTPRDPTSAALLKGWGKSHIQPHPFADVDEAESWLEDNDIRGNVTTR